MQSIIQNNIRESTAVKNAMLEDAALLARIEKAAELLVETFRNDGKVLFCGNGGSAADAHHIPAARSGRIYTYRAPLYAEPQKDDSA